MFSHGVIVECMRISGAVTSFHAACRAVLQAALGQSTGDDSNRPLYHCNGREFQRLPDPLLNPGATVEMNAWKPSADVSAAQAFEEAKELIHKDRLDTQVLGMERLVDLTSPSVCGNHISLHISLQLVKEDPLWIVKHVISNDKVGSRRKIHDSSSTKSMIGSATTSDEGHHVSKLRALGLRVLCNALSLLAEMEILCHNLQGSAEFIHPMTEIALLDSLIEDLKGVNRPPSVVQSGTNTLASAHEATLALRILRILGESSETVRRFLDSDVVLDRMETAQTCGRATHLILQHEAERTYAKLTEDIRSC